MAGTRAGRGKDVGGGVTLVDREKRKVGERDRESYEEDLFLHSDLIGIMDQFMGIMTYVPGFGATD